MTTASDRIIDALDDRDRGPRQSGGSWLARCPAHDDRKPSLSVRQVEGVMRAHGVDEPFRMTAALTDGERLMAWWKPPQPGKALLVYFHGNGGSLRNRRFRAEAQSAAALPSQSLSGSAACRRSVPAVRKASKSV